MKTLNYETLSPRQRLAMALALAITAPSEDKSEEALQLAHAFTAGLGPEDVRAAKRIAVRRAKRFYETGDFV